MKGLKLEEVWARKKEASAQVSTQTRTLAIGFVAFAWALLTVHDDPLKSMAAHVPSWLILTLAVLSVLILILDMLQYVNTTNMADATYHEAENADKTESILYDSGSFAYRAQAFFYRFKFIVLAVASIVLGVIFFLLFPPLPK
jgi:NADH:ubiquinone oxidoreductase subunit 3 (subunit A)